MRAELPWNVAGIPPEAREAARAAARREGLSVGEWLTRRILRSFSGLEEDLQPGQTPPLDSWGLPQSAASRRDTEEMLARVSRTETESTDVNRRIEEQLRSVARRLDSAERSQSENNRVMSKTATEINIATREQAQAFDQLATHVVGMGDRLERLERSGAHEGLKEAVKALHQGLSRLADQITQTNNQSATQVSALTGNLEQLVTQLGQLRTEALDNAAVLEQRVAAAEKLSQLNYNALDHARAEAEEADAALASRIEGIEKASHGQVGALDHIRAEAEAAGKLLEQRIATVERATQVGTNALDHALEKLEAQASSRAADLAEAQKRETQTEVTLMRLEENLSRLESKVQDSAIDRRLDGIDRSLADIAGRIEHHPTELLEDSVRQLNQRIEALDKQHQDLLVELRANLAQPATPPPAIETPTSQPSSFEAPSHETAFFETGAVDAPNFEGEQGFAAPEPTAFEAPPLVEPATGFGTEGFDGFAPGFNEADPFAGGFAPDHFAAPAFGAPDLEAPQDPAGDPSGTGENFLAAARRSAQAAAQAEAARGSTPFNWRRESQPDDDAKPRSRYLVPLAIGLVIVLALAASLVLSQRMQAGNPPPVAALKPPAPIAAPKAVATAPSIVPLPDPADSIASVPPDSVPQSNGTIDTKDAVSPPPTPPAVSSPAKPAAATPALAGKQAAAAAGVSPSAGDRLAKLANAGNAIAQTMLGLKYLDGQGVPVDVQQAGKWLLKAADQGQGVAQYRLGTMYERGQGTKADPVKAGKWYLAAANLGNRKAMHNLAVAYADGAMGKKDMAEAARWFSKAAALGLSDSQFNLAVLYERGDGVPQSLIDAFKWYAIAAAQGDSESKQRLSVLQTQLSDSDRAAAQKSAAAFHAAPLNRAANVPPELSDLPK